MLEHLSCTEILVSAALQSDMLLHTLQGPILQVVAGCLPRMSQRPALRSQVGALWSWFLKGLLKCQ